MKYAVAYIDYGETVDWLPGVLGVYDTWEEAHGQMVLDAKNYGCVQKMKPRIFDDCAIVGELGDSGCGWRICEVKDGR